MLRCWAGAGHSPFPLHPEFPVLAWKKYIPLGYIYKKYGAYSPCAAPPPPVARTKMLPRLCMTAGVKHMQKCVICVYTYFPAVLTVEKIPDLNETDLCISHETHTHIKYVQLQYLFT